MNVLRETHPSTHPKPEIIHLPVPFLRGSRSQIVPTKKEKKKNIRNVLEKSTHPPRCRSYKKERKKNVSNILREIHSLQIRKFTLELSKRNLEGPNRKWIYHVFSLKKNQIKKTNFILTSCRSFSENLEILDQMTNWRWVFIFFSLKN